MSPIKKKTTTVEKSLPTLSVAVKKAWDIVKETWMKQFGLGLLGGLFSLASFIISLLLFVIVNAPYLPKIALMIQQNKFMPELLGKSLIVSGVGIFTVWVVFVSIISIVFQVALMRLLNASYNKKSMKFKELFSSSLSKVLPLLGVGILTSFMVFGGMFLFFIPGIVIAMLTSFATWEIVLEKRGIVEAIKQSYTTVKQNFWGIFGRLFLMGIAISLVNGFLNGVSEAAKDANGVSFVVDMVSLVFQYAAQFFMSAFALVIYRQAKEASKGMPIKSIKSMVVLSVVGWVVGMLFWVLIGVVAMKAAQEYTRTYSDQLQKQQIIEQMQNEDLLQATPSMRLRKTTR